MASSLSLSGGCVVNLTLAYFGWGVVLVALLGLIMLALYNRSAN